MNELLLNYFEGDEMAANVWFNKYRQEGDVTPLDMHKRMASLYAKKIKEIFTKEKIDSLKGNLDNLSTLGLYFIELIEAEDDLLENFIFSLFDKFKTIIPGGSTMAGLGKNIPVSLSNCFGLGQPEDNIESIFNYGRDSAQLYKRRGGVGMDVSKLRPKSAIVHNAAQYSTGSVSYMDLYSFITRLIGQDGRRGATMLSMDVRHPDIIDFINCKKDLDKVTGANISVKTNAEFMQAVKNKEDFYLRYPIDSDFNSFKSTHYDVLNNMPYNEMQLIDNVYITKVKAEDVWNTLITASHNNAEPGILFWDNHLKADPAAVYNSYIPVTTNPLNLLAAY